MARSQCLFAHAAKTQGLTVEQFEPTARHDNSFAQIALIANTQNDVATDTEIEVQLHKLKHYVDEIEAARERYHVVSDEAGVPVSFAIKTLTLTLARNRLMQMDRGNYQEHARCMAMRAGALPLIYQHVVTFCLKDPKLVPMIFDHKKQDLS